MSKTIKITIGIWFLVAGGVCQAALISTNNGFLSFEPLQGALVNQPAQELRMQFGGMPGGGVAGNIDLFTLSAATSNIDQSFVSTSGASFNAVTSLLTNGIDDGIWLSFYALGIPYATAAGYESMRFANNGSANGIDFAGYQIDKLELIVHQIDGSRYEASYTFNVYDTTPVPLPPAVWLLGSGLIALVGVTKRRRAPTGSGSVRL